MRREFGACGVGLIASRANESSHQILRQALNALSCVEHRGACGADGRTGDGSGIMADIPFELLGYEPGSVAVGTLFVSADPIRRRAALRVLEETMSFLDLEILEYRSVPVVKEILGPQALEALPYIVQVIISRPPSHRTAESFNRALYLAQQKVRARLQIASNVHDLCFISLSTTTVVYKALTRAPDLPEFFPDLRDDRFKTRFALFHRRFSTNTRTTWDRAQPFRVIAHNGEINTITGNLSWSYSREQALGLQPFELLTHTGNSDSGNLNEQVEALRYRSGMPHIEDVLAIVVPPPQTGDDYYTFWGRAMEPWDGPAFITYSDGASVGARLDRNGFRPCRWAATADAFYLASEAGIFGLDEAAVEAKGTLNAGGGVRVTLDTGRVHFRDPSCSRENADARFEARLYPLQERPVTDASGIENALLFGLTHDELERCILPMIATGKEPIGSMGDTAQLGVFSDRFRGLFDFMFQNFAQVTNPPLDYLREQIVTDLATVLGPTPNIYSPKELLPPAPAYVIDSPLLSEGQYAALIHGMEADNDPLGLQCRRFDTTFVKDDAGVALKGALDALAKWALQSVRQGASVLILSDRAADEANLPIPALLALRAVVNVLNQWGERLRASIVLDSGEIRTTHHFACAIGFGATAVCPHLAWAIAGKYEHRSLKGVAREVRESQLRQAFEQGLLKVMSKVGIASVRSYRSSKLFTPLGLGHRLCSEFFPGLHSPVGGLELEDLAERIVAQGLGAIGHDLVGLPRTYRFQEHRKGGEGERHDMTAARARQVHDLVLAEDQAERTRRYESYDQSPRDEVPHRLSDLLAFRPTADSMDIDEVEPIEKITARFGAGAMSFGAISAEAQRDIIKAMETLGARSNSGEGGENPFYYIDGTKASTKQIASGRFGVTAEYLVSGREIEIKMAQGAKPGEGGQLMGVKVDAAIAFARHARPGVDLISPPPLHDIYSIEDLKELIYQLRQLNPDTQVCVKLVSGTHIGAIAVGVVKAGADVIQISGGSGGTGAAPLSSMMHAGLPWELGIVDVHQALVENGLRSRVRLRVDGGLHRGTDVVMAALLGADEFGFGKSLLIAQGCIMARICEKNRCPRGIATHDPKFKAKYRGTPEQIVTFVRSLADDVRKQLALLGLQSLDIAVGQANRYLIANPRFQLYRQRIGIDLTSFLHPPSHLNREAPLRVPSTPSPLNAKILSDIVYRLDDVEPLQLNYKIKSTDRAIPATLSGRLAQRSYAERMKALNGVTPTIEPFTLPPGRIVLRFEGSAGQGFGAFTVEGMSIELRGEANDSVCKSMSGGRVVIRIPDVAQFEAEQNVIVGNGALYGATGGRVFIHGRAGDRFAVRNSGAVAVVEGAGLHACEYMTGGLVVILGQVSHNIGAGMSGGRAYIPREYAHSINQEYATAVALTENHRTELRPLLESYLAETGSVSAHALLAHWDSIGTSLCVIEPNRVVLEGTNAA